IYAAQKQEDWAGADRMIGQLQDKSLVGHVLAARYLGSYQASAPELREWLKKYADLPDADRITKLAAAKSAPHYAPRKRNKTMRRGGGGPYPRQRGGPPRPAAPADPPGEPPPAGRLSPPRLHRARPRHGARPVSDRIAPRQSRARRSDPERPDRRIQPR